MTPLLASHLRSQVTIYQSVTTDDGSGGQLTEWLPTRKVRAEAINQNGREAVIAGALQGVSAWRIRIRHCRDVSTTDQLMLDGKMLNIRSVDDPDGRRAQLVIFADTASAEG